ncbi:phosphoribosylformylglycinamidine synthase subunit PurS [Limosilactobacillus reuteri]|uniref:Phosphoribosylformylglycinamidine synthase subunit PurS n=1 Tax=Limosilactobacillus reuteri TaxID=1598 RepID=A0A256VN44_LIMRT|nr:phosphoribosylformylglycinamidine synthase subunit PurS [Limosilactobacillus reuteri]OYS60989.1 phosphoribosylformylglycinamidine synthase [Limosilactobacillus reuteri]OYS61122.1 phosphoribosylformylglycinamidine synthase [Limosilactobacillus reuteri]OYS62045.1 phosphoribosylformylglycinamidine synthase [Limosilactobacillus reuteri]OYS73359.1 phosphoribosylformylglycinamidine synthase [Limosilactobacillus reuteri]OYS74047.1 phosphoribosylformylglycinamidine synthase [Limosilactobacillus reu
MVNVRIFVTYKQSVFDPQGETIKDAIHSLGHDEVITVKVGKFFDVTLDTNEDEVATAVKEIADQLLVNFNMETYTYQVMEEA